MRSTLAFDHLKITPLSFSAIKGWAQDNHSAAFMAFLNSARRMVHTPSKTRALGIGGSALSKIARFALDLNDGETVGASKARQFFEAHFTPHMMNGSARGSEDGFITGFFEPDLPTSRHRTSRFRYPLYSRPADLVDIDESNRPEGWDDTIRFGRQLDTEIVEYDDREAIQNGALEGKGLEICWLESLQDQFFIHVQGAARLNLQESGVMRVTFSAKSGHAYTSLAKTLCAQTGIDPAIMTADRLLAYMAKDEARALRLLAHNRSYIFFKTVPDQPVNEGPIAAAKVPLTPHRSLAVDRTLHTFGTPFFISTPKPLPGAEQNFAQLMVAQDTGSAITGPRRGDVFCGTGKQAEWLASRLRNEAQFIVLVPNP